MVRAPLHIRKVGGCEPHDLSDVERVGVLLHEPVAVDVLADELQGGLLRGVVLFAEVDLVGGGEEEGLVHVEVVGHLDGADELHELALEVFPAVRGHHEVVLHLDGHTLPDDVGGLVGLALGEHPGGRLVGHAGGEALVEAPDGPLELLVRVFEVEVREDVPGERGVGGVGDEAVHPVRQEVVGAAQDVREVPALVALVPLGVELDLARCGPEDVFVVREGGLGGVLGHGATEVHADVALGSHVVGMVGAAGVILSLHPVLRAGFGVRSLRGLYTCRNGSVSNKV
eukprot:763838-Hanusia_phi.AAC.1